MHCLQIVFEQIVTGESYTGGAHVCLGRASHFDEQDYSVGSGVNV